MKKLFLIIISFSFMFINNCFADTTEIKIDYNLSSELKYEQNTVDEMKKIGCDFRKFIVENDVFNDEFYHKLDSFIIKNNKSLSSLTALSMIIELCFLNETYDLYSSSGEKIIDYLITNYKKYVQGKIALIAKATLLENRQMRREAIRLLEENYEVIISIETDPNFQVVLNELSLNGTGEEFITAGYYFKLGYNYETIHDLESAKLNYNKVIKQYPQTNYAKEATDQLKNLK